ncbi:MAG: T9SS type A sorting domain-containing protein [Bacteroidota bacterium]
MLTHHLKRQLAKASLLVGCCFVALAGRAQTVAPEVVAGSGAHFTGTNAQVEWTAGESAITTLTGTSNVLTQGFHQTFLTITAIDEDEVTDELMSEYDIHVLPNPVQDALNIRIDQAFEPVRVVISDARGKRIHQAQNLEAANVYSYDFSKYADGLYFIYFYAADQRLRTFKVLKSN